jgi:hypothetical protein
MSKTIKQHFVPITYLKHWSLDENRDRNSKVYCCHPDGKVTPVGINVTAFSNHTYSRNNPNDAEAYFDLFETDWNTLIQTLADNNKINCSNFHQKILIQSVMYSLRNPIYNKVSDIERIELIRKFNILYLENVLFNGHCLKNSKEAYEIINTLWQCKILKTVSDDLITSDNPTSIFIDSENDVKAIVLPLTPKYIFIAVKKVTFTIESDSIKYEDVAHLNLIAAYNANRFIYSSTEYENSSCEIFIKIQQDKINDSEIGDDYLGSRCLDVTKIFENLSFINKLKKKEKAQVIPIVVKAKGCKIFTLKSKN